MPQIEYRRRSRVEPDSAKLLPFARNVHSQLGEDGIIARISSSSARHRNGASMSAPMTARISATRAI